MKEISDNLKRLKDNQKDLGFEFVEIVNKNFQELIENYTPKYFTGSIDTLKDDEVFVFGSNELGIHGRGSAKDALKFGAVLGKGFGHFGQTFAIPTKKNPKETLTLSKISEYLKEFEKYVEENQQYTFLFTKIGCGLAGYSVEDIKPLLKDLKRFKNIKFDKELL